MTICQQLASQYPALRDLFDARERLGMERYGAPLDPLADARVWTAEAIEEMADGMVYVEAELARNLQDEGEPALVRRGALKKSRALLALAILELRRNP